MADWIINDGPEDRCFGCGHSNPHGLKLVFRPVPGGSVESTYTAPETQAGSRGVLHGGIQATLLDEVMGVTAHVATGDMEPHLVTADFQLRYRRPVPTGTPLLIRARLDRMEGRDYFLEGEIIGPEGDVLTRAQARWCRIAPDRSSEPARSP